MPTKNKFCSVLKKYLPLSKSKKAAKQNENNFQEHRKPKKNGRQAARYKRLAAHFAATNQ